MAPSHSEESNRPQDAMDAGKNIAHGSAGDQQTPSHVDRASKAAPLPDHEAGAGMQGSSAGAGHSQGLSEGADRGQGRPGTK